MKVYAVRSACFDPAMQYIADIHDWAATCANAYYSGLGWEEFIFEIKEPLSLNLLVRALNWHLDPEQCVYWCYMFGTSVRVE